MDIEKLEKLKVVELRAELQNRGLDTKGVKAVLVDRLKQALENEDEEENGSSGVLSNENIEPSEDSTEDPLSTISMPKRRSSRRSMTRSPSPGCKEKDETKSLEPVEEEEATPLLISRKSKRLSRSTTRSPSPPKKIKITNEMTCLSEEQMSDKRESGEETQTEEKTEMITGPPITTEKGNISENEEHGDAEKMEVDNENADESKDLDKNQNKEKNDDAADNKNVEKKRKISRSHSRSQSRSRSRSRNPSRSESAGRSRSNSKSRSPKRERRSKVDESVRIEEDEPSLEEKQVGLSWFDSDLHLRIDPVSFNSARPCSAEVFNLVWSGARANYGVRSGKVCFEVRLSEESITREFRDENHLRGFRCGFSILSNNLLLGDVEKSFGYCESGKKVVNNQYEDYGEKFELDDVIGCYLNLDESPATIGFTKNGKELGVAFELDKNEILGESNALFPHVLTKGYDFQVNFADNENLLGNTKRPKRMRKKVRSNLEKKSDEDSVENEEKEVENEKNLDEPGKSAGELTKTNEVVDESSEKDVSKEEFDKKSDDENDEKEMEKIEKENEGIEKENEGIENENEGIEKETENTEKSDENIEKNDENIEKNDENIEKNNENIEKNDENIEKNDENIEKKDEDMEKNKEDDSTEEREKEEKRRLSNDSSSRRRESRRFEREEDEYEEVEPEEREHVSLLPDFTLVGLISEDLLVAGPQRPESRKDCEVILMVGLPNSGKSYWVENHLKDNPNKRYDIIGPDALIKKMTVDGEPRRNLHKGIWGKLYEMALKSLMDLEDIANKRRRNVILDQTNVYASNQRRKMRGFGDFKRIAVVCLPTDEEFKNRMEKWKTDDSSDTYNPIKESTLDKMKANFTLPSLDFSWFDEVRFSELSDDEAKEQVQNYNTEGKKSVNEYNRDYKQQRADRYNDDRRRRDDRHRDDNRSRFRNDRRGPPANRWGGGYGDGYGRGYGDGYGRRDDRYSGRNRYGSGGPGYGGAGGGNWVHNNRRYDDRSNRSYGNNRYDSYGGRDDGRDRYDRHRNDVNSRRDVGGSRSSRDFRPGHRDNRIEDSRGGSAGYERSSSKYSSNDSYSNRTNSNGTNKNVNVNPQNQKWETHQQPNLWGMDPTQMAQHQAASGQYWNFDQTQGYTQQPSQPQQQQWPMNSDPRQQQQWMDWWQQQQNNSNQMLDNQQQQQYWAQYAQYTTAPPPLPQDPVQPLQAQDSGNPKK